MTYHCSLWSRFPEEKQTNYIIYNSYISVYVLQTTPRATPTKPASVPHATKNDHVTSVKKAQRRGNIFVQLVKRRHHKGFYCRN